MSTNATMTLAKIVRINFHAALNIKKKITAIQAVFISKNS